MARKLIISFLVIFFIITFTNSLPLEEDSISLKEEKSIESIDKRQTSELDYVYYGVFDPNFYPFDDAEEFEFVTGTATFTRLNDNKTRIYGQCNTGFIEPNTAYYSFWIVPYPLCPQLTKRFDLTPYFTYYINDPGTSAFQYDFSPDQFTFEEIKDQYLITRLGGYTIGAAQIKSIKET